MAVWFRRREVRQLGDRFGPSGPMTPLQYATYQDVDASREDNALQSVAVAAAVDLIASIASELPLDTFRGRGRNRQEISMPARMQDPDGSGYGLEDWTYRAVTSWLLRGNLYGIVVDRAPTFLEQVELLHPDRVSGTVQPDGSTRWTVAGREITDQAAILHRRAYPLPGVVQGRSPIAYHASTIGVTLASTQFGWQWFRDSGHPSGILRNQEMPMTEETARTAKNRFLAALRGSREPLVLGKGWEWQQVQVNPDESQFLGTMGYSEAQCARIFGPGIAQILGYETGGSLTYSNIQDHDLHLLKYALNRWLRRLERLLSEFLPRPQYVLYNRDALLQTNTLQRYRAHASALDKRWRTVNEVREVEDLPPVPWGDEPNPIPGSTGGPAEPSETGNEGQE